MSDETSKTGPITDQEAREMLSRFNSSHWKNQTERARYSIPADPRRDDDIRLGAYIEQTVALRARLRDAEAREKRYREALERICDAGTEELCGDCRDAGLASAQVIAARALTSPVDLGGPTPGEAKEEAP